LATSSVVQAPAFLVWLVGFVVALVQGLARNRSGVTMSGAGTLQRHLPVIGAAVRNIVIFTAVLSIPLASAQVLDLSAVETSSWVAALFAFAVALSDISLLGFGNYFWALVLGTGVSLLLERDAFRALRERGAKAGETPNDE
jgi:predicted benzoate:H+ symporter BenE